MRKETTRWRLLGAAGALALGFRHVDESCGIADPRQQRAKDFGLSEFKSPKSMAASARAPVLTRARMRAPATAA